MYTYTNCGELSKRAHAALMSIKRVGRYLERGEEAKDVAGAQERGPFGAFAKRAQVLRRGVVPDRCHNRCRQRHKGDKATT